MDDAEVTEAEEASGPELVFALIYPVGTDSEGLVRTLRELLTELNYTSTPIHIIEELLEEESAKEGPEGEYERYSDRMQAGNEYRRAAGRPEALALYAAATIGRKRLERFGEDVPLGKRVRNRHAYILQSLKRPEEVDALRDIYGGALVVVAAHSSPEARRDRLEWNISRSQREGGPPENYRPQAEELIARDRREATELEFGQRVSDAFPLADVFVDASHPERLNRSMGRFLEAFFGYPFHTPTKAEYGLFHAYGAALRSADLSRQVGAAIASPDAEILALGTNEVPKAGGGLYWSDDAVEDRRDYTYGVDISTEVKRTGVEQLLERLEKGRLLAPKAREKSDTVWTLLQGLDFLTVGEFGRAVHAEMAAIVDAARRGVSIQGCTLYTTTFPCSVCARHIVASGIREVVYNEPYPKSLARNLHPDSISIEGEARPDRVFFRPFVGVSPSVYVTVFKAPARKTADGQIPPWNRMTAKPRQAGIPPEYLRAEVGALMTVRGEQGQSHRES